MKRALDNLVLVVAAVATVTSSGCAFDGPDVVIAQVADAARRGDRDDFMACFTPRSRAVLEVWWTTVDKHQPSLGALGAGDVQVVAQRPYSGRDAGPERALVSLREGERQIPLVLHRMGGAWRIDLLDSERVGLGGGDLL